MRGALRRPAVPAFIAIALGIALGSRTYESVSLAVAAASLFTVVVLAFVARPSTVLRAFFATLSIATLGTLLICEREQAFESSALHKLAQLRPDRVWVEGTIESDLSPRVYGADFSLQTSRVFLVGDTLTINEPIQITLTRDTFSESIRLPQRGDLIRARMRVDPIEGPRNPHERSYLYRVKEQEGARAVGWINSGFDLYVLSHKEPSALYGWLATIRRFFIDGIESAVRDREIAPFIKAIVLGERSEMDSDLREEFKRAGLAHLLAVSGFNVALVALLIVSSLRLVGVSRLRLRVTLSAAAVAIYCAMIGFQPSVLRAMIMIECYLLAKLLERKSDPINILFAAATLNLILKPYDLFDAGFQLSYGCVFGLLYVVPTIELEKKRFKPTWSTRLKKLTKESIYASAAATLTTMPILAYHFGTLGLAGLFTNLLAIPLVSAATIIGFILAPLSLISQQLALVYGEGTTLLSKLLFSVVRWSASIPIAQFKVVQYSWPFVLVLSVLVIYILSSQSRPALILRLSHSFFTLLILHALGFPFRKSYLQDDGKLSLMFFDVGQGDCILINTPSGKNYMVDFGGISHLGRTKLERSALNFLEREGVERLDGGFITHLHADHYAGLTTLAETMDVSEILTSGDRSSSSLIRKLDRVIHERRIACSKLERGRVLNLDEGVKLFVLNPDTSVLGRTNNLNHTSLALKLVYGNTSVLLLGDIESEDEERLVAQYGDFVRSDIVKVAHHGSKTSSSPTLIKYARPREAVISVGSRNTFGHPSRDVVHLWRNAGVRIDRTDREGAIMFKSDGRTIDRVNWRDL